jgi:hypothetical protein
MITLNVTLDFACCECEQPVTVTVRCSGPGPGREVPQGVAAVKVPCPTCGQVNHLCFEPSGVVRSVRPYPCYKVPSEPSIN